jgi:hypothetical protein
LEVGTESTFFRFFRFANSEIKERRDNVVSDAFRFIGPISGISNLVDLEGHHEADEVVFRLVHQGPLAVDGELKERTKFA